MAKRRNVGDCMAFDKGKYDVEYAKAHIKCKRIPFNDMVDDDKELLEWLEQQGNVTQYIKGLIRADIKNIPSVRKTSAD